MALLTGNDAQDSDPPATEVHRRQANPVTVQIAFPFSQVKMTNPFSRDDQSFRELARVVAELATEVAPGLDPEARARVEALAETATQLAGPD